MKKLLFCLLLLAGCDQPYSGCVVGITRYGDEVFIGCYHNIDEFNRDKARQFWDNGVNSFKDYKFTDNCSNCQ